jgi:hypothetical protein
MIDLTRDKPFEIITILFGYGANEKSVFTGLLTSLHGAKNVSNVTFTAMLDDRFALSDLEGKSVNIDTELTGTTIRDTSILESNVRTRRRMIRRYTLSFSLALIRSQSHMTNLMRSPEEI